MKLSLLTSLYIAARTLSRLRPPPPPPPPRASLSPSSSSAATGVLSFFFFGSLAFAFGAGAGAGAGGCPPANPGGGAPFALAPAAFGSLTADAELHPGEEASILGGFLALVTLLVAGEIVPKALALRAPEGLHPLADTASLIAAVMSSVICLKAELISFGSSRSIPVGVFGTGV